jgi:hypothetical protein
MAVRIPSGDDIERRLPRARGQVYDIRPDRTGLFIAQAGQNIQAWGERGQDEEDRLDIARAKSHYLTERIKAEQELEDEPDYTKWGDKYSNRLAEIKQASLGMIRSGRQQEIFKTEIGPDEARATSGVFDKQKGRWKEHQIADLMKMGEDNMAAIAAARDEPTRAALLLAQADAYDAAAQRGVFGRDDAMKAKLAFKTRYATLQATTALANNPEAILGMGGGPSASGGVGGNDAALISSESGGKSDVVNEYGYVGTYQFGAPRLQAMGVYKPGANENLNGWEKTPQDAPGKWSGEFSIPGHPRVKTMEDFRASPEAQKAVFALHNAKMDEEIKTNGFDSYVGKDVSGVTITRDSLRNMLHLGGVGSTRKFLEGRGNPKDANGTSMLDYARMGSGSKAMPEDRTKGIGQGSAAPAENQPPPANSNRPAWWSALSPEQQLKFHEAAKDAVQRKADAQRVENEARFVQDATERVFAAFGTNEAAAAAYVRKNYQGVEQNKVLASVRDRITEANRVDRESKDDRFQAALDAVWEGKQIGPQLQAQLERDGTWDKVGAEISAQASGVQRGSNYLWLHENYWSLSPAERMKVPLATIKENAGRADYDKIVEARKKLEQDDPSLQTASQYANSRFKALNLKDDNESDRKKLDAFHREFAARRAAWQAKNGVVMPDSEQRKMIDELTGKIALERPGWFNVDIDAPLFMLSDPASDETKRLAKDIGAPAEQIPALVRALGARGIPVTIKNLQDAWRDGTQ